MIPEHETLVMLSKSFGLFYLMILFALVVAYAYWPSNKNKFNRSVQNILEGEDFPK